MPENGMVVPVFRTKFAIALPTTRPRSWDCRARRDEPPHLGSIASPGQFFQKVSDCSNNQFDGVRLNSPLISTIAICFGIAARSRHWNTRTTSHRLAGSLRCALISHKVGDYRNCFLLRVRRERPRCRSAADQRDELTSFQL
jgi:hypothetical protein